jgi:hypothetical protein
MYTSSRKQLVDEHLSARQLLSYKLSGLRDEFVDKKTFQKMNCFKLVFEQLNGERQRGKDVGFPWPYRGSANQLMRIVSSSRR